MLYEESMNYIDDLISKENSLRDLSKTIKSITIDSESLATSISEDRAQINNRQKRIYNL